MPIPPPPPHNTQYTHARTTAAHDRAMRTCRTDDERCTFVVARPVARRAIIKIIYNIRRPRVSFQHYSAPSDLGS